MSAGDRPPFDPEGPRESSWLMGIKVPVTISFGRAKLRLEDLLRLSPGSVVELDRAPGEMVDLMVGGSLVARAEVVAMDENYGLRIREVVAGQGGELNGVDLRRFGGKE